MKKEFQQTSLNGNARFPVLWALSNMDEKRAPRKFGQGFGIIRLQRKSTNEISVATPDGPLAVPQSPYYDGPALPRGRKQSNADGSFGLPATGGFPAA
jgi:hypothetical protein